MPRWFDRSIASDLNEAMTEWEWSQTLNDGMAGVQQGIELGHLVRFAGPGNVPYIKKRLLRWGREQGAESLTGTRQVVWSMIN